MVYRVPTIVPPLPHANRQVSMAIAFALLVFGEVVRCCGIPVVSERLQAFMAGFADERDSGPVYITHLALLLGVAVPMWLAPADDGAAGEGGRRGGGGSVGLLGTAATEERESGAILSGGNGPGGCSGLAWLLVSASGMVCLGLGDTAASVVGVLAGRTRLFAGSRKTVEGTLAGAAAMLLGCAGLWAWDRWAARAGLADSCMGICPQHNAASWPVVAMVTVGAALLEAVTHQLDNLVVPIYYAAHLLLALGQR